MYVYATKINDLLLQTCSPASLHSITPTHTNVRPHTSQSVAFNVYANLSYGLAEAGDWTYKTQVQTPEEDNCWANTYRSTASICMKTKLFS